MNTLNFLFAWSTYVDDKSCSLGFKPVYFGVRSDLSVYSSDNWNGFYLTTRCYCEHSKQLYCDGFLTANPDAEIYEHKSYRFPFLFDGNKITPLKESDITLYPYEPDMEAPYFRNHCAYVG